MASIKSFTGTFFWLTLLSLLPLSINALAQTMREDANAFDKPDGKPTIVRFSAGSNIRVLRRDGFWIEVSVAGKTGWLKASQVSFAASPGGSVAIDTGRMGGGNIVSSSAARGLSAKDLLSGQPNFNDVSRLEAIQVAPKEAQAFALAGGLKPPPNGIRLSSPPQTALKSSAAGGASSSQSVSPGSGMKKKNDDDW